MAINPGSTSTKIAVYQDKEEIFEKTLELLRKQKSLYCLLEIMRLHILVGLKEKRDMSKEQEDIKILQSFFEE